MKTTREAAEAYADKGWTVIPIPHRKKAPDSKGWQKLRITPEQIPHHFNGQPQNIGVHWGGPSGGVVDVDLDAPEALHLADAFLPKTGAIFGRAGSQRSHRIYRCPEIQKTNKFQKKTDDKKESMLVEIRADGTQTVVPPSTHPSGERIEWVSDGEPREITAEELTHCVGRLAAAVLMVQEWPGIGSRQDAALALSGFLLGPCGMTLEEAEDFIRAVAEEAGDEEAEMRVKCTKSTASKIDADEHVVGLPRLCELLGIDLNVNGKRLREWLGAKGENPALEFNKHHAGILLEGQCHVLKLTKDENGYSNYTLIRTGAFEKFHSNRRMPGEKISVAKAWWNHPRRRNVTELALLPGKPTGFLDDGRFNMWSGFAVEATEPDERKFPLLLEHVEQIISGGDPKLRDYIWTWAAQIFQQPLHKLGVALALRGVPGAGKSIFGEVVGGLFGAHFLMVDKAKHISGNFNDHLKRVIFLMADEAYWAGDVQGESALKSLITANTILVEPKGINAYPLRNYSRLLFTSNKTWIVPIGHGDRRFAVIEVAPDRAGDRKYFGEMLRQMEDGGKEALLSWLLAYDIGRIDINTLPTTAAREENLVATLEPLEAFWFDLLQRGSVWTDAERAKWSVKAWDWEMVPLEILCEKLLDATSREFGGGRRGVLTKLGIFLRKRAIPPGRLWMKEQPWVLANDADEDDSYIKNRREGRGQVLILPPLDECREWFAREVLRMPIEWPEPEFKGSGITPKEEKELPVDTTDYGRHARDV